MDYKSALGWGNLGDQWLGISNKRVAAGDGAEAECAGDRRGIKLEAVDVGKLAELDAIGADEVVVGVGEGDVGGVGGIRELDEEAVIGRGGGRDAEDLEEDGAVIAGDLGVGIHGVEELEEGAWCESETPHLIKQQQ